MRAAEDESNGLENRKSDMLEYRMIRQYMREQSTAIGVYLHFHEA